MEWDSGVLLDALNKKLTGDERIVHAIGSPLPGRAGQIIMSAGRPVETSRYRAVSQI
jgi:hypothetical protein